MFKKILVPTDGSPLSEKSAKAAIQFAAENHASIVTVAVIHPISALSLPCFTHRYHPRFKNHEKNT